MDVDADERAAPETTSRPVDIDRVRQALDATDWEEVREQLGPLVPQDVASVLRQFDEQHRVLCFRALSRERQAEVFGALTPGEQDALFRELTGEHARELLQSMNPDDRTGLLSELPAAITDRALEHLEGSELETARQLLGYPEESVGRLMTPDYVAVQPDWTIEETVQLLREETTEVETIASVFVVDERGHLLDDLRIRQILTASENQTIEDIRDHTFVDIDADADQETAVRIMEKYDLKTLPVVDSDGQLLGIVTIDDIVDVARREASEDFQRLGASAPLDRPYFDLSILEVSRKRVGWLLLLFLGGTLTSSVIGAFEEQLSTEIMLSFFIPLLIGTGGNAGAQSVTTIIRAIALHEVRWENTARVLGRELATGLVVGTVLGVIGYFFATVGWGASPGIALVVALTLPAVCTWANVVAGFVPIVADRVGIDPTVISAPLITTVVDATGLILYFALAAAILGL